jgi:hypothetical protein
MGFGALEGIGGKPVCVFERPEDVLRLLTEIGDRGRLATATPDPRPIALPERPIDPNLLEEHWNPKPPSADLSLQHPPRPAVPGGVGKHAKMEEPVVHR